MLWLKNIWHTTNLCSQELIVLLNKNSIKLQQLETQCLSYKNQKMHYDYFETMEQTIMLMQHQLQLIDKLMKEQNQERIQIKYTNQRLNLLERAASHFYEIWKSDQEKIEYLKKYLEITLCYKGTLSHDYINGLCDYSLYTQNVEELTTIYQKMKSNTESQKKASMTLFMLTNDEYYYERALLNDCTLADQFFELKFHLFATKYFQEQNCYHTKIFHQKKCESMSFNQQRIIQDLQLSFMKKSD